MNWVFVGASTIASQYVLNAVRVQTGNDVTWIVSGSASHGSDWAKLHNIPNATTDIAEALADDHTQAVYISSTNEKHFPQAMKAIAAGKHVLCEKPLAMTRAEAIEMVAAAEKANTVFATNHHLRCSGSHRKIRELVKSERIGKILSLRIFHAVHLPPHLQGWRINDPAAGGGVIPDITVHNADTARFILDEDPVDVVAQMTASGMGNGVEDSAMSVWSMPSGAMVFSHESFTHPFAGSGLEVHGTKGSIFAHDVMTQEPTGHIKLITQAGQEVIPFWSHSLYQQGLADFVGAVNGLGRPAADGVDGVKSLAVALAVRNAAKSGQRAKVIYDGDA